LPHAMSIYLQSESRASKFDLNYYTMQYTLISDKFVVNKKELSDLVVFGHGIDMKYNSRGK